MALLLGSAAYAAKELFDYNRENFKFDKEQYLDREALRISMSIRRFELFREDIRDLVMLTVGRMDVYHLVGALFLAFCIVLYCQGRVKASAPPWVLSLFLLSNACAFVYLLLAVWLSMHASISSHSFGVRLLTRFVRLPIPSMRQITELTTQAKDYEKQNVGNLLTLPMVQRKVQGWTVRGDEKKNVSDGAEAATSAGDAAVTSSAPNASSSSSSSTARLARATPQETRQLKAVSMLPETAEQAVVGGEDLLSSKSGASAERHIVLFRQLQGKWQCYDAYCRVCMGLGVNNILQALSYYAICHTLVENHTPTTGYCMVFLFQCTTIALAVLDLAGLQRHEIIAVQIVGVLPCVFTAWGIANGARFDSGALDPEETYLLAPLAFLCQIWYLELWLRVAAPGQNDGAKLPRRFRQVLFLDVFGDASGWDPTQAENSAAPQDVVEGTASGRYGAEDEDTQTEKEVIRHAMQDASSQLALAQWGLRRWNAAPEWALSQAIQDDLVALKDHFITWGHTIKSEMDHLTRTQGVEFACVFDSKLRPWNTLSEVEREADPFQNSLIGPFADEDGYKTSYFHYSVETGQTFFEDDVWKSSGTLVLEIQAVKTVLHDLERVARRLLEIRIMEDMRLETQKMDAKKTHARNSDPLARLTEVLGPTTPNNASSDTGSSARRSSESSFANLVGLFQQPGGAPPAPSGLINHLDGADVQRLERQEPALRHEQEQGQGNILDRDPSSDPTLRAMAGEHAKHFAPERLPWLVLSRLTRALQLCWGLAGVMTLLRELDLYIIDFQEHHGERRQLCVSDPLSFERVDVDWPHGSLFRPQSIFSLAGRHELHISSPFGWYRMNVMSENPLQMEEIERMRSPWFTVPLCRPWPGNTDANGNWTAAERQPGDGEDMAESLHPPTPCLLAAIVPNGLAIWPSSHSHWSPKTTTLLFEGVPWKSFTGGVVNCSDVREILSAEDSMVRWCLVFIGWDGKTLPVVVLPLWSDLMEPPASDSFRLVPSLSIPVPEVAREKGISAMHLSAHRGWLWALLASGDLEVWNLFGSTSLGRFKPQWPLAQKMFKVVGLYEDMSGVLFALGLGDVVGPLLFRAQVPREKFRFGNFRSHVTGDHTSERLMDE